MAAAYQGLPEFKGAGWPDVTFDYQPENIASYITQNFNFPLDLTPYVPKSVLANYATNANSLCMSDGHLYCLKIANGELKWRIQPVRKISMSPGPTVTPCLASAASRSAGSIA